MVRHCNIQLCDYNSFGIGAVARSFIEITQQSDLHELFDQGLFVDGNFRVVGGGNNIIFAGDIDSPLLHIASQGVELLREEGNSVVVRAMAGVDWDEFVAWCVERGYWGVENLSLIPGTVGAAPVQNIGAYGVEAKDALMSVEMFSVETGKVLTLSGEFCDFGYRDSIFKWALRGKVIITSVTFGLSKEANPRLDYGDLKAEVQRLGGASLANIRSAVVAIRQSKLPDPKVMGNAGSFFKNPVVDSAVAQRLRSEYPDVPLYDAPTGVKVAAGWLIDRCALKGWRGERVGVHDKQALVLVNLGGATGEDVIAAAQMVQRAVRERFDIEIDMEVNIFR